jgi:chromosome segregation ATPase
MATEHPDSQVALLKGLAKVEKEVRSLKKRLGNLAGSVEKLELMDFQDQLNSLDERITKLINHDLQQLKQAHDAIAEQNKQIILTTQRHYARSTIISIYNDCQERIGLSKPDIYDRQQSQMALECSSAISKLDISLNPLSIAQEFRKKWYGELDKLGIEYLKFPPIDGF